MDIKDCPKFIVSGNRFWRIRCQHHQNGCDKRTELITEDRDFGDLVYAHQNKHGGIILIRYPSTARKNMADAVRDLIQQRGEDLVGCFVVVSPLKVRIRTRVCVL